MRCKFPQSPNDIQTVIPGCSPDLNMAIESGVIPDTCSDATFNGLEELSYIGARVREPFDVIHFDRAYSALKERLDAKKENK